MTSNSNVTDIEVKGHNNELIQSSYPFGMTVCNGKLMLAYNYGNDVYTKYIDDNQWVKTGKDGSFTPALSLLDDAPCIAYREKGGSSDAPIRVGGYSGSSWSMHKIPTKAANEDSNKSKNRELKVHSDKAVGIVDIDDYLFMAYKTDSGHYLGMAWSDSLSGSWHSTKIINPDGKVKYKTIEHGKDWVITNRGPALTDITIDSKPHLLMVFGIHNFADVWCGYRPVPENADDWNNMAAGWTFKPMDVYAKGYWPAVVNCGGKAVAAIVNSRDKEGEKGKVYTTVFDPATKSWSSKKLFKDHSGNAVSSKNDVSLAFDGTHFYLSCADGEIALYKINKDYLLN